MEGERRLLIIIEGDGDSKSGLRFVGVFSPWCEGAPCVTAVTDEEGFVLAAGVPSDDVNKGGVEASWLNDCVVPIEAQMGGGTDTVRADAVPRMVALKDEDV